MRRALALALAVLGAALAPSAASAASRLPPIRHVFVIVLENESAASTFGPNSPAPYLAKTLTSEGAFVPKYYATGHASNDNYISMISGQAPNPQNQADCFSFSDFTPGTIGPYGQAIGSGCVYPSAVKTIADQLDAAGLTWRDYNQSMGADPTREAGECGHPGVGQQDHTQSATATDQYATRHDPFVYFHSIIDNTTLCDSHVVNLNLLPQDLANAPSTPNYVFITPDLCADGHDATCKDPKRPGGYAGIEQFLQQWVPKITTSPAFRQQNGLLAVIFDESATSETSSCCGEIAGPNSPEPGITGPGGGNTGAVLISPCIKPGTVTKQPYNHYTLLRSFEDLFGLAHLGYAGLPGETSLGSDVFNRACAANIKPPLARVRATLVRSRGHSAIRVSWSASGATVKSFTVQIHQTKPHLHRYRTLVTSSRAGHRVFVGQPGAAYQFRLRATGASGVGSSWANTRSLNLPPVRGRR
ncbi:MAG TPA: alkaline phosphatase family protein [Solirubrobacteraceae bacterium]